MTEGSSGGGHWRLNGRIVRVFPERFAPTPKDIEDVAASLGRPITREELVEDLINFARRRGFPSGTIAKVVMVSRFGDCGVTRDLHADRGYSLRVYPECLEEVSAEEAARLLAGSGKAP